MKKFSLDKIKGFISTGKGKVITASSAAVVVVAAGIITIFCLTGASNGSLPSAMTGTSSTTSDGTFTSAGAINGTSSNSSSPVSKAPAIEVQSISMDKTSVDLNTGSSTQLSYSILPSNATDKSVSWDSSDKSVAAIDEKGSVTAKASGTTVIKVTASNGKNATCTITVKGTSAGAKSKAGNSGNQTPAPAPAPKYNANNAAGLSNYASYGFPHGVKVNNAQVLTQRWNFDTMVSDVKTGVSLGDTVNYAGIPGNYRSRMLYYGGATSAAQKNTDSWINEIKRYHINESCEFYTDRGCIYQNANGEMIVRGKKVIHITSADRGYYSELGVSGPGTYYRIIDVIVATGAQNGYGIPQSMYSICGEYFLTGYNRA